MPRQHFVRKVFAHEPAGRHRGGFIEDLTHEGAAWFGVHEGFQLVSLRRAEHRYREQAPICVKFARPKVAIALVQFLPPITERVFFNRQGADKRRVIGVEAVYCSLAWLLRIVHSFILPHCF